VAPQTEHNPKM